MTTDIDSLALTVIVAMAGRTFASAESLTGGQIGTSITAIPGASKVYRGGVISYATDVKESCLGVNRELLAEGGSVQADVALQMAVGVANLMNSDFGLSVTGVAGPEAVDGHLPGTVFVACVERDSTGSVVDSVVEELHLYPEIEDPRIARNEIRDETVAAALELLLTFL